MKAEARRPSTIVFLGDSITEDPSGYVAICSNVLAAAYPGVRIVNAGVGGNKASDLLGRLESDVLRHRPDLVLISVGINDVWHGFYDFGRHADLPEFDPTKGLPLDRYEASLREILERLCGTEVTLIAPTVIGDDPSSRENGMLRGYVDAMERLSVEFGTGYCPMHDLYWEERRRHHDVQLTWDGVHMTSAGAKFMAREVLGCLGLGK